MKMMYRFKGMKAFEDLDNGSLMEFLKLYTKKNGQLSERLEVIRSGTLFGVQKSESENTNNFPWIFSSFDNDRFDERVDPAGWELSAYAENPVVLWAHNHGIPAIGFAEGVTKGENLAGTIRFNAKEYDPFGWSIGERVRNGVIRAGSVGFRVLEVEFVDHRKSPDEVCDLIFRKQELLEFSICNVPANPFALQQNSYSVSKKNGGDIAPTSISMADATCGFMPYLTKKVDGGSDGRRIAPCA